MPENNPSAETTPPGAGIAQSNNRGERWAHPSGIDWASWQMPPLAAWMVVLPAILLLPVGLLHAALGDSNQGGRHSVHALRFVGTACLAAGVAWVTVRFGLHRLRQRTFAFYLLAMALLLLTMVPQLSITVHGARRWLAFGALRFQPSFLLLLVIPIVSAFGLRTPRKTVVPPGGTLPYLLLPCFTLVLQPNFGLAIVCLFLILICGWLNGVSRWRLMALLGTGAIVTGVFLALNPNRIHRIAVWFGGSTYQIYQSLMAQASGGWFGKGIGESDYVHGYLPEWQTDFNFAILVEEWGAVACVLMLVLFLAPLAVVSSKRFRSDDPATQMMAIGLAVALAMMAFVHAAVNMALVPVSGIPLPFVSGGGSYLVVAIVTVALLTVYVMDEAPGLTTATRPPGRQRWFRLPFAGLCLAGVLSVRAYILANDEMLRVISNKNHQTTQPMKRDRGTIWIRNGTGRVPVAISQPRYTIGVDPRFSPADNPARTALAIANATGVAEAFVHEALIRRDGERIAQWRPLDKNASAEQIQSLTQAKAHGSREERRDLRGVRYEEEEGRIYPFSPLATHLIGGMYRDGNPVSGVERAFDFYLRGASGWVSGSRDGWNRMRPDRVTRVVPATTGDDLVLKIEFSAQRELVKLLASITDEFGVPCAALTVATDSGDILAYGSSPTFDQNHSYATAEELRGRTMDRVRHSIVEVGPLARLFLAATSSELSIGLDPKMLHRDMPAVDFDALNARWTFLTERLRDFGFLKPVNLEIGQSKTGSVGWRMNEAPPSRSIRDLADYGLGLTATPLQLVTALDVLHAGGLRRSLRLIEQIGDNDRLVAPPHVPRYVVSPTSARRALAELGNTQYFQVDRGLGRIVFQAAPVKVVRMEGEQKIVTVSTIAGVLADGPLRKTTTVVVIWGAVGPNFSLKNRLSKFTNQLSQ